MKSELLTKKQQQQQFTINKVISFDSISQSPLNNLSPEPWGPSLFSHESVTSFITDEQLLSPVGSATGDAPTPFNEQPSPSIQNFEVKSPNQLLDTTVESQMMCFENYDTPPLSFEDEFQKFGQVVEDQHKVIIQSYQECKPLPDTVLPVDNPDSQRSEEDVTLDAAAIMGSQGPVMDPTAIHKFSQDTEQETAPNVVNNMHNYSLKTEKIEVLEEEKEQKRRVPKLKLILPKPESTIVNKVEVSTPQITNEIIAMETEFDLISYITNVSIMLINSSKNSKSQNFCKSILIFNSIVKQKETL